MVIFEKASGRYDLGRWTVKGNGNECQTLRNRFPFAASAQPVAMLIQAVLAGLALSGSADQPVGIELKP